MTEEREQLRIALAERGFELGEAVAVHRTIEAASDRIWEAITQPGHLERVHPFCRENVVQQWPGVGAIDTITYYSGVHYQRDFVAWYGGRDTISKSVPRHTRRRGCCGVSKRWSHSAVN